MSCACSCKWSDFRKEDAQTQAIIVALALDRRRLLAEVKRLTRSETDLLYNLVKEGQ